MTRSPEAASTRRAERERPGRAVQPPIAELGVIGDRRTIAVVASDGSIPWLCLPWSNSAPVLGSLLHGEGGVWRFGPAVPRPGVRSFVDDAPVLRTCWPDADGVLELTDAMADPGDGRRHGEAGRTVLRRLRCLAGRARARLELVPVDDMRGPARLVSGDPHARAYLVGDRRVELWASVPIVSLRPSGCAAEFELAAGEEAWAVLHSGLGGVVWSAELARCLLDEAAAYWAEWLAALDVSALPTAHRTPARVSAMLINLLTCAPSGAPVAAATTSLPERLGGDRNYDYRWSWIRDASLALDRLSQLGAADHVSCYLDWVCSLHSRTAAPLQVAYSLDGGPELPEAERWDVDGYAGSRPVRRGNRAATQLQHDPPGYLADCSLAFLERGGRWDPAYWRTIEACADFTARSWRRPDCGIWELPDERHWVSSKVMAWVTLDRSLRIAERTGTVVDDTAWRAAAEQISQVVLREGWSAARGSFRQHLDTEAIDASVLLIPLVGLLPSTDPRVTSTVRRVSDELVHDGFVWRFDPAATVSASLPMRAFEAAFLPATFWLATVHALRDEDGRAGEILDRALAAAGPLHVFSEEYDPGAKLALGNTPLLFAHAEYLRAVYALAGLTGSGSSATRRP